MVNGNVPRKGGPKTARGKSRSSRNARRHGLFASEFSFSAADELEFDNLSSALREVLKPNNALLDLLYQDLVACAWRMRSALRYEQQELLKQFAIENQGSPEVPRGVGVGVSFPSRLKPRQSQQHIKLLDDLKDVVQKGGTLRAGFEDQISDAFGPELWKTLTKWAPPDGPSVWVARCNSMAAERGEIYGLESTMPAVSAEEKKRFSDAILLKNLEMTCKLIDVYKNILINISNSPESDGMLRDERLSRFDLAIRYHTTARRDFCRSLREYREAENPG